MAVARTASVFLGTDEATGVTIVNNATTIGSEVDLLGNNTSEGWLRLFLKYTGTVAAGSIDVSLFFARVTGQSYSDQAPIVASVVPINGTQKIYLGDFKASRYVVGQIKNNAVTASITNVTLGYELFVES